MDQNCFFEFSKDGQSFRSTQACGAKLTYFPLCGTDSTKIKSSISPFLSGDIKTDKHCYLTKPASTEDLRHPARNFYLYFENGRMISTAEPSDDAKCAVEAGFLWHKITQIYPSQKIEVEILTFVPVNGMNVEISRVSVKNKGTKPVKFTPTAAVAVFGRSLSNKHDHEHVTSLLHRAKQNKHGIIVTPTMRFNEEGHKANDTAYFVMGCAGDGRAPAGTFPTTAAFYGDSGTLEKPEAVTKGLKPRLLRDDELQGKEIVGALRFVPVALKAGEESVYLIAAGISDNAAGAETVFKQFNKDNKVIKGLEVAKKYWSDKVSSIQFGTASSDFNNWMRWVTLQPVLRRIYGCSFLPDHDYGKGGKGWRDLWQDLLSLILIEPSQVRDNLINNFGGIRIDGTNATIIGAAPGEFIADRNSITRVWMDHGVWPYLTTKLYIDQTGDYDLLLEKKTYFRDPQLSRTFEKDTGWTPAYGSFLRDRSGDVYEGTILEHILVQNLVQFFNVGEHNITRLESADWNDGLDMAFKRGESVAFMAFYGGNLNSIADLLTELGRKQNIAEIETAVEIKALLDTLGSSLDYNSVKIKQACLKGYFSKVQPELSGNKTKLPLQEVINDLRRKAGWIAQRIRTNEKVTISKGGKTQIWFNGYYDNQGKRVEGSNNGRVQMTLTGQVFPLMSGIAEPAEINAVVASVRAFLKDKKLGGFRLNTDFGIPHYLDMGRAFGFAYGTKENGAFFSHMTIMYAYALYSRGFVKEGFEVLDSIYKMAMSENAKIYPGVPEYFDSCGKGMYHYLTGSASWYVLTVLTQAFGVRGRGGDLLLDPKLLLSQFNTKGEAAVSCQFTGKNITVFYQNRKKLEFGKYKIKSVVVNGEEFTAESDKQGDVIIPREWIESQPDFITLTVTLE